MCLAVFLYTQKKPFRKFPMHSLALTYPNKKDASGYDASSLFLFIPFSKRPRIT